MDEPGLWKWKYKVWHPLSNDVSLQQIHLQNIVASSPSCQVVVKSAVSKIKTQIITTKVA